MPRLSIDELASDVRMAELHLEQRLEHDYPVGTIVRFHVMHGQINFSRGEVIGAVGGRSPPGRNQNDRQQQQHTQRP